MKELLKAQFDANAKWFSSVGITATKAAELRFNLAIVTAANIAQGMAPARYIRSSGKFGRAIFVSSGLQRGNPVSEYLLWREIARAVDDNNSTNMSEGGRWSRHLTAIELDSDNLSIQHKCTASTVRVTHQLATKGFGELEFDESRNVPDNARYPVAVGLRSRRERWCNGFGDALACPEQCARAFPQLFRLVKFAAKIDLGLELQLA